MSGCSFFFITLQDTAADSWFLELTDSICSSAFIFWLLAAEEGFVLLVDVTGRRKSVDIGVEIVREDDIRFFDVVKVILS